MNTTVLYLATTLATVAIGVTGWFAMNVSTINGRIDSVTTAQAATQQKTDDIDIRLTRIEGKLDCALSKLCQNTNVTLTK